MAKAKDPWTEGLDARQKARAQIAIDHAVGRKVKKSAQWKEGVVGKATSGKKKGK